jgi:rare lipoprotein A
MRAFLAMAILCVASVAHAATASCYGNENHQLRTATGEAYNPNGLTAAHRTLPFGTRVTVTNVRNGQSVTVTINDRGPFVRGRDIDLSLGSCRAIGLALGEVSLQVLGRWQ